MIWWIIGLYLLFGLVLASKDMVIWVGQRGGLFTCLGAILIYPILYVSGRLSR